MSSPCREGPLPCDMKGRRGFTILELVLALILVSAVAAVTIPAFFLQPGITLENAGVLLARDLRAAQNRSAYMAEACRFVFLSNGDGYYVSSATEEVLINPRTQQEFVRNYSSDGVFRGVVISGVDAGPDRTLHYDDRGRAQETVWVTLSYQGEARVVMVEKGSGDITILGSTSGWKDEGF